MTLSFIIVFWRLLTVLPSLWAYFINWLFDVFDSSNKAGDIEVKKCEINLLVITVFLCFILLGYETSNVPWSTPLSKVTLLYLLEDTWESLRQSSFWIQKLSRYQIETSDTLLPLTKITAVMQVRLLQKKHFSMKGYRFNMPCITNSVISVW